LHPILFYFIAGVHTYAIKCSATYQGVSYPRSLYRGPKFDHNPSSNAKL